MIHCMLSSTLFTKMNYSLIEIKLRRFIHLGHKNTIYVPPVHQKTFWKDEKHHYEVCGTRLIGQIVEKNKTEDINSIVPIILKIEKENKPQNYEYLIYLLAVCAKFNIQQCTKMRQDANAIIYTICTDGLKLLMFYTFCTTASTILHKQGYIPEKSSGLGNGIRKAMQRWYLERDPLETIECIIKHMKYCGNSHKNIMNTIHLKSNDPRHQIYIVFVRHGIKIMKQLFGPKMLIKDHESSKEEKSSKTQQLCIYNYINLVYHINDAAKSKSINDLKWNILGKDFEVVVPKMLQSPKILISFVQHLPLKTLLENTYSFYRHGLFKNLMGNQGCMEFILRFKNHVAVNESGIHPIDSYLEFLRYIRSGSVIAHINTRNESNQLLFDAIGVEEGLRNLNLLRSKRKQKEISIINLPKKRLPSFKPYPTLVLQLQEFLSIDLVEKTLKNLRPSGRQLLIAYDNRTCMKSVTCKYMHVKFLKVSDAIMLTIQSMIYQEQSNKPLICGLYDPEHRFKCINVNNKEQMTATYLEKHLFKNASINSRSNTMDTNVKPLCTINWAKKCNRMFDVFLFLGTGKMDLNNIIKTKANYEAFSNSKIKIIVCCLTGNHSKRGTLCRDGFLFVYGFDKNVIRIINSFISDIF